MEMACGKMDNGGLSPFLEVSMDLSDQNKQKQHISDVRAGLILFTVWFLPKELFYLFGKTKEGVLSNWLVLGLVCTGVLFLFSIFFKCFGIFKGWLKGLWIFSISIVFTILLVMILDILNGQFMGVSNSSSYIDGLLTFFYCLLLIFTSLKKSRPEKNELSTTSQDNK